MNGIPADGLAPSRRIHKGKDKHRLRGSRPLTGEVFAMNFVGIDIGGETHFAAAVNEQGTVTL
ncbi:hypothetical protein, partial [Sabulibacter ruber]|uniref:hypothetical protein n=1 Tax=Sabulibacter ruber TaxID=2811901 RepID=UPI001A976A57